jgi:glycosyltransferase involved in cell wall biosynthesis
MSVIIPAYQEEKMVLSLLEQLPGSVRSRHNLEVIVSDGGSTDRTKELAKPHADILVESCAPQNISVGRNRGASSARGEILIFLNADVRLPDPDLFFSCIGQTMRGAGVAAATCNVLVNPEEERLSDYLFHRAFNRYCRFLNVIGMGMGRGECHVVRRSVFEQAGGYNEQIAAGEDYELFLRLRKMGTIVFIPALTVYESPRRYRAYGYFRIALLWFLNGASVLIFRRSLSKEWIPVR